MAVEAQRLISISFGKIVNSHAIRGGMSLHRNLLVSNVLNKAKDIYLEQSLYMDDDLSGDTAELNPEEVTANLDSEVYFSRDGESRLIVSEPDENSLDTVISSEDKENTPPSQTVECADYAYYEDESFVNEVLERPRANSINVPPRCLKRRRTITEIEEAVSNILPKRLREELNRDEWEVEDFQTCESDEMDVEPISNLVSIFNNSLSGLAGSSEPIKITRTVSTPDLYCKMSDSSLDLLNRPVLALTV